ncbi:ribosomal protein S18-alanine N-acetyltransferase [Sphingomonas oryzagri]|jgi:ribosomal-protein-alanine N-acetyltransferase|uniref:Ribosomal protein S18-alanine N-acetyltransferase n=1 Tax=Sphingomonas oryzagri TaxID=3042314 RepID=A0ABT6N122_9SPHN|nr:ribosomal protein S18-alanine N-acetyltransferase [Sphingomonas oryzagri]MDH7639010.1 ribosomal protein S18-alanine N-acetyltransferase [Sphingomonas oryzagri]
MNTLPTSQTELVEGTAVDLDEVMATMHLAFDPAFGEAWTRSQCAGIMGLGGVWLLLARRDGQAAGFALSRGVLDEAELLLLAVQPDHRRFGIGRMLLDAVANEARSRGATRLHLEMRDGNPAAILYERAGFHEIGRRKRYYRGHDGSSFDAITLACRL